MQTSPHTINAIKISINGSIIVADNSDKDSEYPDEISEQLIVKT